jgi:hypothetical protein
MTDISFVEKQYLVKRSSLVNYDTLTKSSMTKSLIVD